jgi:hypothetical protein
MQHKSLSIQGAVNLAGAMLKDAVTSFCTAESHLLSPKPESYLSSRLLPSPLAWVLGTVYPAPEDQQDEEGGGKERKEVERYVRGLRSLIAGTVNWVYETEIYFGKKGEEVRTFGWVFLNSNSKT